MLGLSTGALTCPAKNKQPLRHSENLSLSSAISIWEEQFRLYLLLIERVVEDGLVSLLFVLLSLTTRAKDHLLFLCLYDNCDPPFLKMWDVIFPQYKAVYHPVVFAQTRTAFSSCAPFSYHNHTFTWPLGYVFVIVEAVELHATIQMCIRSKHPTHSGYSATANVNDVSRSGLSYWLKSSAANTFLHHKVNKKNGRWIN